MWYFIKSFWEIEYCKMSSEAFLHQVWGVKSCVVWSSCVTVECLALNPCCLSTKMSNFSRCFITWEWMFQYLADDARQGNWAVVFWFTLVTLLENTNYIGFSPLPYLLGKIPLSTEHWKMSVSIGASSSAAIFKNHGGSWSGPGALLGPRFFSCFNTPSEFIISRGTSS